MGVDMEGRQIDVAVYFRDQCLYTPKTRGMGQRRHGCQDSLRPGWPSARTKRRCRQMYHRTRACGKRLFAGLRRPSGPGWPSRTGTTPRLLQNGLSRYRALGSGAPEMTSPLAHARSVAPRRKRPRLRQAMSVKKRLRLERGETGGAAGTRRQALQPSGCRAGRRHAAPAPAPVRCPALRRLCHAMPRKGL